MQLSHARRLPLDFGGVCTVRGCRREDITPGRTRCFVHAMHHDAESRRGCCWRGRSLFLLLIPPTRPLASWLFDPSLLPKRPPGRVHQEISQ